MLMNLISHPTKATTENPEINIKKNEQLKLEFLK